MVDAELAKIGGIFLLSAVKLLFAPGTAVASGFTFWKTVVVTTAGGTAGVLFFYFLGQWIMQRMGVYADRWRSIRNKSKGRRSVFNRKNRFIIRVKHRYGLIGLALLTPCVISIPIGAVVAARFYNHDRLTLPLLILSVILWCIGLTWFSITFKTEILHL